MNQVYNIAIKAFGLGTRIASWKSEKIAKMRAGQRESLRRMEETGGRLEGCVWFHAASLGEFEQGRPLIERLKREHPERRILLTFFSPSGYEVRKNYDQVDEVAYLPLDTPRRVRRFLDAVKPSMAVFIKYEFWGNYLSQLRRRGIPTYIISAIFRPSQVFFKPYGGTFRKMLRCFNHLYVQDERSRELLDSIGISATTVAGDTRFDRVTDVMKTTFDMPDVERFMSGGKMRLVVGSSWEADEDLYADYLNAHPEIKAVVAPHEMRGDRLTKLAARFSNGATMLSQLTDTSEGQVIIVDSFGKLASLYRYGDAAYIGGGFGAGIHNINEAAVYGIPVIFGPKHQKFKEAGDLITEGGGYCISSADDLTGVLDNLLTDTAKLKAAGEAAGAYITRNLGASDIIYKDLFGQG